jgi:hypothetical protein
MKTKRTTLISALLAATLASTATLAAPPGGGMGGGQGRVDNDAPGSNVPSRYRAQRGPQGDAEGIPEGGSGSARSGPRP